jgi:quercetin dioxygenase-like cupin family protein
MQIAAVLFLTLAPPVFSQDPVIVSPGMVKVELENDRIRVLRIRIGPHEMLAMHEHPPEVVITVTRLHARQTLPDGSTTEYTFEPGSYFWRERRSHAVENLSGEAAEMIEIELKKTTGPAVPVAIAESASPAPPEPIPVQLEPHHHVRLQNQYVRILESLIDPGGSTFFHTHSHDIVVVSVNEARTQSQSPGKEWEKERQHQVGEVLVRHDSTTPFTHRLKNVGTTIVRDMACELMQ